MHTNDIDCNRVSLCVIWENSYYLCLMMILSITQSIIFGLLCANKICNFMPKIQGQEQFSNAILKKTFILFFKHICLALGLGGCGFDPWPNLNSDLLSISLLISETLIILGRTVMTHFRIIWQEHPDITNKLYRDVKPNKTNTMDTKYININLEKS